MKRWLLPASALVLVVTACGAGAKPAPRVTEVEARVPSVHALAARRKRAAKREARMLLREFVPPPGARAIQIRPGQYRSVRVLHQSPSGQSAETAEVHAFWSVGKSLGAVAAFVRAHPVRGFGGRGAEYGTNVPHFLRWGRSSLAGGATPRRFLTVTAVALARRTIIRVDAQAVWVYPRSPSERVPPATSEIVVRAPRTSVNVTDPAKVARIVRWFDGLPISPPGVALMCALTLPPDLTLSFRSAGGAWLAKARMPRTGASICDPVEFTIGGEREKPLIDGGSGESFVRRLESLLGLHLIQTYR